MTDEEKIEADKAKVAALKNAQANIKASIERIETLERALKGAVATIERCAESFVAPHTYVRLESIQGARQVRVADELQRLANEYRKPL